MIQIPKIDLYKLLGLNQKATEADIKVAYRSLITKFYEDRAHPELKAIAEGISKELNMAKEWLTNPDKRRVYDSSYQSRREFEESELAKFRKQLGFLFPDTLRSSYERVISIEKLLTNKRSNKMGNVADKRVGLEAYLANALASQQLSPGTYVDIRI